MSHDSEYIIIGAGVIGLSTALELGTRHPTSRIIILAKHLPGDRSTEYCSPWAGANWLSVATDGGRQEGWDRVTYEKFGDLADEKGNETGVKRLPIRAWFDREMDEAGVLSVEGEGKGRIWYKGLTGLRFVEEGKPEGSVFGFECASFVVDVQRYLPWLQGEVLKKGIDILRVSVDDIGEVFERFPGAKAVFNCTGLGSYNLKGVEDKLLYPTRGQVMLVENPKTPMTRMYFRSPQRVNKDTTYIFPRNPGGGVILGGCRVDNDWSGEVSMDFAEDIKRRCCALAPELGRPEDLKVIQHGVGLRPSRKGGARVEREIISDVVVIHNYGAGGAGYQASWGMAKNAVDLVAEHTKL
ncbi:putative D-amino acid oxidase [Hyaloscypha variabilis F]|uniref:Putative D-amino acid oxidase n=1 Tax=Hyaloscypha variabilis (strain UAMH 11265 / GT02V1 / F) TaxID=1149755 RepID=A0A2J6RAZ0_HYAVF|nr:putative D-amino acid oxidase [Hyaloscypha variabilis F]